jgi:type I restriction enzyme S subunit
MGSEWKQLTLGDVITLKRGYDLPSQHRLPGPFPIVSSSGISGSHNEAKVDGPGVVTGRYGTIGQVHFVEEPYWPLNTTLYVQDFKGNHRRYVKYLLETIDYRQYSDKAAVPGVNRNHLHEAIVKIPALAEQERIAKTLATLDRRIDLLRQTNTTLEAIAQALFKSWFVDFDPVHAKAEGREPEAMDAATASLFPSEFDESELGLIPEGWKPLAFGDAAYLSKGSVNPLAAPNAKFDHYSLPAFDAGQLPVCEAGGEIKSNKTPVLPGAVLVSKLNPHIPRIWPVGATGANAVCSTEFLVWVPKAPASSVFVYSLASSQPFNSAMRQLVTGTSNSHQRVKPDQLNGLCVCAASDAALEAFASMASPLLQRILDNRQQSATLAHLRDTLLPRLISGKLRLPDAEREIEAVV